MAAVLASKAHGTVARCVFTTKTALLSLDVHCKLQEKRGDEASSSMQRAGRKQAWRSSEAVEVEASTTGSFAALGRPSP